MGSEKKFDDEWITITVNTKDRSDYLLVMLSSLLNQTHQKWSLIICDASEEPVINLEPVERLLRVIRKFGHGVLYETDQSSGIPQTYQKMMELAETELIVRMEDDVWFEGECLERAHNVFSAVKDKDKLAAVGFMTPNYAYYDVSKPPKELQNGFRKVEGSPLAPNLPFIWEAIDQQEIVVHEDVIWPVCVIHAGSLYKRSAAENVGGFCTHLSPVGHREETLFYSRLYFAGYDLAVRSTARLWHFEASLGGSRPDGAYANSRQDMRRSDESKFQAELSALMEEYADRPLRLITG